MWPLVKAANEMRNLWAIFEKLKYCLLVGMIGLLLLSCTSSFYGNEGSTIVTGTHRESKRQVAPVSLWLDRDSTIHEGRKTNFAGASGRH